jgi:outer membrane biosynthesis protein TonB
MRISVKYAVWLLAMMPLAQGCDHKTQTAQTQPLAPPIVDAPPPKPATVSPADLPPPVIGDPAQAKPANDSAAKPPDTQKKPVRHPKKPATPAQTPPAPAQEATTATPSATPSVSAIGELSGGASGDLRSETEGTINNTEKGVNGITRSLSDAELKTAAQIREFLKQAREALATGDVDGAHTLANKAKVLLTELNPQ